MTNNCRTWLLALVELTSKELPGGHALFPLMECVQTMLEVRSLGNIGSRIVVVCNRLGLPQA